MLSFDLDGNDIYFVQALLSAGFTPELVIVECNAKFPPPVRFQIAYDAHHVWQQDDYFGASLCSWVDLFTRFDYMLVCCNAHSGANAFFVKSSHAGQFDDVPKDIGQIYVEPRYRMYTSHGHNVSPRTLRQVFRRD